METDYISREAVLMQLCNRRCATGPDECLFKITHNGDPGCFTAHCILKIPAADVRPVVLCRDCEYSQDGFRCDNPFHNSMTFPDDFCSRGERRGAKMKEET